jgi:hypothetical protein
LTVRCPSGALDPARHREALDALVGIHARSAAPVLRELQRLATGYTDTSAVLLSLGVDAHSHVPSLDAPRFHLRVYVSPTTEHALTGTCVPLDWAALGRWADLLYTAHRSRIEGQTTREIGVAWGRSRACLMSGTRSDAPTLRT